MTTTTISYKGHNLRIGYTYHKALPGSYDIPPEPEVFEIDSIHLGQYDITELIEDQIEDIETIIINSNE